MFTKEEITKLYVATFNRAADSAGLSYWSGTNNIHTNLTNLEDIAAAMTQSLEYQSEYEGLNREETVIKMYQNLFNREPDSAGLDYWVNGDGASIPINKLIIALINGAKGDDITLLNNKTQVGIAFSNIGLNDIPLAKEALSLVTKDESSIQTAEQLFLKNYDAIKALDSNNHWDKDTITYQFNTSYQDYYEQYEDLEDKESSFNSLTVEEKNAVRDAMQKLNEFIQPDIVEVSSNGDIKYNKIDIDYWAGFAYYPEESDIGGDVFLSNETFSQSYIELNEGKNGYNVIAHETAHAFGLKHPFEGDYTLPSSQDNKYFTVMSYTETQNILPELIEDSDGYTLKYNQIYPQNYSLYDIETLQYIYGANPNTNTNDNTYTLNYDSGKIITIYDAGGIDTIDLSNTVGKSIISLEGGTLNSIDTYTLNEIIEKNQNSNYSDVINNWIADNITELYNNNELYLGNNNLSITTGTVIENLITGSGDDTVWDNKADNKIVTGAGNDTLYIGVGGNDTIDTGNGYDKVYIQNSSNNIILTEEDSIYYIDTNSYHITLTGVEEIYDINGNLIS